MGEVPKQIITSANAEGVVRAMRKCKCRRSGESYENIEDKRQSLQQAEMCELDVSLGTEEICKRPILLKCPETSSCPHMYISSYLSSPHTHSCFLLLIPLAGNRDRFSAYLLQLEGSREQGEFLGTKSCETQERYFKE